MIKLLNKMSIKYSLEELTELHLLSVSRILNNIRNEKQFITYLSLIESSVKKDLYECETDKIDSILYIYNKKINIIKEFIYDKLDCDNKYLAIIYRIEDVINKQYRHVC